MSHLLEQSSGYFVTWSSSEYIVASALSSSTTRSPLGFP